jgi:hypothetical protein
MDYSELKTKFYKETSNLSIAYPLFVYVFDKEIRLKISNVNFSKEWQYSNGTSKFFALIIYNIIFYLKQIFLQKKEKSIYLNMQKFNQLERNIYEYSKDKGWNIIKERISLRPIFKQDSMFEDSIFLRLIDQTFINNVIYKIHDNKLESIQKKINLNSVENKLKVLIEKTRNYLLKRNVKLIIASGDSSVSSKILLSAAKLEKIPYYVICHGYIQSSELITIAPIYADKLFVWSQKQKKKLEKVLLESHDKSLTKIQFCGYPGDIIDNQKKSNEKKLLIVLEIVNDLKSFDNIKVLTKFFKKFEAFGVTYRCHPADVLNDNTDEVCDLFKIDQNSLSNKSLFEDITSHEYIVGTNSAALFQAALITNNVFQIKEYTNCYIEGVNCLDSLDIYEIICGEKTFIADKENSLEEFTIADLFN